MAGGIFSVGVAGLGEQLLRPLPVKWVRVGLWGVARYARRENGVCGSIVVVMDDRAVGRDVNRGGERLTKFAMLRLEDRIRRRANDRIFHVERDVPQIHVGCFVQADATLL